MRTLHEWEMIFRRKTIDMTTQQGIEWALKQILYDALSEMREECAKVPERYPQPFPTHAAEIARLIRLVKIEE